MRLKVIYRCVFVILADYSIASRGSFPSAVAAMSVMHERSGQFRMCNCSCCGAGCSCHGGESHECRNPYSLKQMLIVWRGAVERKKKITALGDYIKAAPPGMFLLENVVGLPDGSESDGSESDGSESDCPGLLQSC